MSSAMNGHIDPSIDATQQQAFSVTVELDTYRLSLHEKSFLVVSRGSSDEISYDSPASWLSLLIAFLASREWAESDDYHLVILCADIDTRNLLKAVSDTTGKSIKATRSDDRGLDYVVFGIGVLRNPLLQRYASLAFDRGFDDDHALDLLDRIFNPAIPDDEAQAIALAESAAAAAIAEQERIRAKFDARFYAANNPDVTGSDDALFEHFMTIGWQEGRDPCGEFSTAFYLETYPDIAAAGANPFAHWALYGEREMRRSASFRHLTGLKDYHPRVAAIVPNFNHAAYLETRLNSILDQTYPNIDILILDDCSTDHSRKVIQRYVSLYPDRIRAIFNEKNAGNVFRQWRRGVEETDSELVWICESDDFCEPDFVEKLVPYFKDDSVSMAFGRIQDTDENGVFRGTLDAYREGAEAGIWQSALIRPAAKWFASGFGVNNVIANVGGCLWRRSQIAGHVWREAETFKVVGDWFLYIHVAGGGQIAFDPEAIAYFRRHDDSTSLKSYVQPFFYEEHERLMMKLRSSWDIPVSTLLKFYGKVSDLYEHFELGKQFGPVEKYCDLRKLISVNRTAPHILIAFYGFIPGGGENFPIHFANALHRTGWVVSVLIFEGKQVNAAMRATLDPAIAVYDASWVSEYGADRFLEEAGISLIHSHNISSEIYFFQIWNIARPINYLCTLHGSYEDHGLSDALLEKLKTHVSHYVYLADKNLTPLKPLELPPSMLTKLPNAMPIDPKPFEQTRSELGIAEDAIVFTLVARGVLRKGWRAAILAFRTLRERFPDRPMHLLLCGSGEVPDQLKPIYGDDPDITFLGFQSRIHGLYRMTDVAIVPTRFAGESFPLCIIEALQVGVPVIASDVGEIPHMLTDPEQNTAGLLIDAVRDTQVFVEHLTAAMEQMLDDDIRSTATARAVELGKSYDMGKLVKIYGDIFWSVMASASPQVASGS